MVEIWNDFASQNVQVVGVHIPFRDVGSDEAQTWLEGLNVTFPVIHNQSYDIYYNYSEPDASYIPHNFIIGRDMIINEDFFSIECEEFRGKIEDVINSQGPLDIEMVMDVSDSMNSPSPTEPGGDSKLAIMKQASGMIVDFLADNHDINNRLGITWFSDNASEYTNLGGDKLLTIRNNKDSIKTQIDNQETGICTAMGAGLQTALDTLSASSGKKFTILLTDGMQNINPQVVQVGSHYEIVDNGSYLCGGHSNVSERPGINIASYDTRVHTIGVGIAANYTSLLQDIASETGGFYRATNDPENDLDYIYFLDLCSCMAGASPTMIHHGVGALGTEYNQKVETFSLNRSVRKITAVLAWKEHHGASLTFWLRGPDGTLLNINNAMKSYENHCMATIYLPRRQNGVEVSHVGQWQMIICGATPGDSVDYHAFIIGEDRDVHYGLELEPRRFEVGDILPIKINLRELGKPVLNFKEIKLETIQPKESLAELLADFRATRYELARDVIVASDKFESDPTLMKIRAMSKHPQYRHRLKPSRKTLSLKRDEFECGMSEKEIIVPIKLEKPGMASFKIDISGETSANGPINRSDMVSVFVKTGKIEPKKSDINIIEISSKKFPGVVINVTPRDKHNNLLGSGLSGSVEVISGGKKLERKIEDFIDGSYHIEVHPPKPKKTGKAKLAPISVLFDGQTIWKGNVKS